MTTATKATMKAKRERKPEQTAEVDPWLACKMSSHIPNAETIKAIEEGLAEKLEPVTLEELRKMWDDK